jgi:hypothetical protein
VDFQPRDAKEYPGSGFFELPGPVDIGVLVKTGLKLYDGGDLFAVLQGVDEGADDAGVAGNAVQADLDVLHIGVYGGFAQQVDVVRELVVGVVQQDVFLVQQAQDALPVFDVGMGHGGLGGVLQGRTPDVGEVHEVLEVVVPSTGDKVVVVAQVELFLDVVQEISGDVLVIDQPHGLAFAAAAYAPGDFLQEALGDVVVDVQLGIAGELDGVGFVFVVFEQGHGFFEVQPDDVVEQDDAFAVVVVGEDQKAGQDACGDLHQGVGLASVGTGEDDGEVDGAVFEVGKAGDVVQKDGGDGREGGVLKVFFYKGFLGVGEVVFVHDEDVFVGEATEDFLVYVLRLGLEPDDFVLDFQQQFLGFLAEDAGEFILTSIMRLMVAMRTLKNSSRVVGEDAEEFDAFYQGDGGITGFLKDSGVEGEPAEFAVDDPFDAFHGVGLMGEQTYVFLSTIQRPQWQQAWCGPAGLRFVARRVCSDRAASAGHCEAAVPVAGHSEAAVPVAGHSEVLNRAAGRLDFASQL